MKSSKTKRIFALAGAILLACLYLSTLIFALIDNPVAIQLLRASVFCTILIPVLIYAFSLVARLLRSRNDDHSEE